MRRILKAVLLVAVLLAVVPVVSANHMQVEVSSENVVVHPAERETAVFNISITNTGDAPHTYNIGYTVSNPGWYFLPQITVRADPGETRSVPLEVTPDAQAVAGNVGVLIDVRSEGETAEKRVFFTIRRDVDILVTGLQTDRVSYRPSEVVRTNLTVKNVRREVTAENAYQAVFSMGDATKVVGLPSLTPGGTTTVSASFRLGPHDSGVKTLQAVVEQITGEKQEERTANIRIESVEQVDVSETSGWGIISGVRTLTAENTGNRLAEGVTVTGKVPAYLSYFVTTSRNPASTTTEAGTTTYEWRLGDIPPGEAREVVYRVNYWMPAAILLILLTIIAYGTWRYTRPHVVKKVYRREGKHTVHLRVENRSRRVIEDVVVKDTVPSVASLVQKFESSAPERIRQGDEETELEWRLGRMEPGEERVLTYAISPQVAVEGSMTLPPAHLQYYRNEREWTRHSGGATARFD